MFSLHLLKERLKTIITWFFTGLLILAPLAISFWVVYATIMFIEDLIPHENLPFYFPGLGLIVVLGGTTLLGLGLSKLVHIRIDEYLDKYVEKVPVINIIYTSARDLMKAFVGEERRFNKPVLVNINKENEIYKLGYITEEDLELIGVSSKFCAVYFPHSYNFSGELFIVATTSIKAIDLPAGDLMKFIVSGGVTELKESDTLKSRKEA